MVPARSFVASEGPVKTRPSPLDLSTTAEYHHSLRGQSHSQNRQPQGGPYLEEQQFHDQVLPPKPTTRRWLPTRPKTSDSSTRSATRSSGKNASRRDTIINPPLPLSRQEVEEFETLPIAVRRKPAPVPAAMVVLSTLRTRLCDDRIMRAHGSILPTTFDTRGIGSTGGPVTNSSQRQLTREEQVAVAKSLRESVILDAADEAIYKIGRRSSRHFSQNGHSSTRSSIRPSMETQQSRATHVKAHDHGLGDFYDSFRWLEGNDDLDLSLQLNDYPGNGKGELPPPAKEHRPAFRRHLSINKIPFGRASTSMSRPGTHGDASIPPSPTATSTMHPSHARRQSRTLSLISTRHAPQPSTSSIDTAAAHYQDPEARAKLRVYLASPQKFDEAVEFGFPSGDAISAQPAQETQAWRGHSRKLLSEDSSKLKTFFSDDHSSVYSDDASLPDPESPRTPHSPDKAALHHENVAGGKNAQMRTLPDSYAQLPAASREMTLRMTLTRPDLRACEDQIYGWQKGQGQQGNTKSVQPAPFPEDAPPKMSHVGDHSKPKESLEAFFASLDEEEEAEAVADSGVVKRFWNKVRRS
ncbi:mucin [Seiridium cupressi]